MGAVLKFKWVNICRIKSLEQCFVCNKQSVLSTFILIMAVVVIIIINNNTMCCATNHSTELPPFGREGPKVLEQCVPLTLPNNQRWKDFFFLFVQF